MKTTNPTTNYFRLYALIALLICFSATAVYAQKNYSRNPTKHEAFFKKVEKLKPGMSKADVKEIMGEPYKLAFELKDDDELEEKIYYKTETWYRYTVSTLIIYQCEFKNDKLVALKQKEFFHLKDYPTELF